MNTNMNRNMHMNMNMNMTMMQMGVNPMLLGDHGFPPSAEGTQRTLSAYNIFVRATLQKLKEDHPDLPQGEHLKKVGELWRNMGKLERAKWRADGEEGSRVPGSNTFFAPKTPTKPSSYQLFVKSMTAQLRASHPENKPSDNMKRIGELWRDMSTEERASYKCDDDGINQHETMDEKDGKAPRRRKGGKDEGSPGYPPGPAHFPPPHTLGAMGGMYCSAPGYPDPAMMGYGQSSAAAAARFDPRAAMAGYGALPGGQGMPPSSYAHPYAGYGFDPYNMPGPGYAPTPPPHHASFGSGSARFNPYR